MTEKKTFSNSCSNKLFVNQMETPFAKASDFKNIALYKKPTEIFQS